MTFSKAALHLSGIAARNLHWTPATFWLATPSELLASLAPPQPSSAPPSRADIARLIERDRHD